MPPEALIYAGSRQSALAWISLVAILLVAPELYDQTLQLPLENRRLDELIFLAAISAFVGVLAVGVCMRWR